jgi:hypothetical protein
MKMLKLALAAAIAVGSFSLPVAPAAAQPGWHNGHHARHHRRHRVRVCRTVWHHHHRQRVCRWVWR